MPFETILIWIVIGAVAGWLANLVVGGIRGGLLATILVGIVGAFVGGWLLTTMNVSLGVTGMAGEILRAFIGAVVFLLVLRLVR